MDFEKFLTNHAEDFKGRNLELIWQFSDAEIESNHDFIQLIFPTNKRSQNSFHGYYLDNEQSNKTFYNFTYENISMNVSHSEILKLNRFTLEIDCTLSFA